MTKKQRMKLAWGWLRAKHYQLTTGKKTQIIHATEDNSIVIIGVIEFIDNEEQRGFQLKKLFYTSNEQDVMVGMIFPSQYVHKCENFKA